MTSETEHREKETKMTDWKEDARFVGAFIRGGSWAVGLRIARRVQPRAGQGTSSKSGQSDRISLRDFATEAGVSTTTISAYLKAWELAADQGLVDHAADLDPDDEYDWETANLFDVDWKHYYRKATEKPAPPSSPSSSPNREPKYVEPEQEPLDVDEVEYEEPEPEPDVDDHSDRYETTTTKRDPVLAAQSHLSAAAAALNDAAESLIGIELISDDKDDLEKRLDRVAVKLDMLRASLSSGSIDEALKTLLSEGME